MQKTNSEYRKLGFDTPTGNVRSLCPYCNEEVELFYPVQTLLIPPRVFCCRKCRKILGVFNSNWRTRRIINEDSQIQPVCPHCGEEPDHILVKKGDYLHLFSCSRCQKTLGAMPRPNRWRWPQEIVSGTGFLALGVPIFDAWSGDFSLELRSVFWMIVYGTIAQGLDFWWDRSRELGWFSPRTKRQVSVYGAGAICLIGLAGYTYASGRFDDWYVLLAAVAYVWKLVAIPVAAVADPSPDPNDPAKIEAP